VTSSLYLLIGFIGVILVVEVLNGLVDHSLNAYGLVPRTTGGMVGIPLSPFLHGSFLHVQSNAVGLLALGCLAVIRSRERFPWVCLVIILIGGLGVWLIGRSATHVGASGLVFGLFGYLLFKGLLDRSILSVLVAVVVAGVFGWAMLSGVLPTNTFVSWEGHLCGLAAGILAAIITPGSRVSAREERTTGAR
jgi:membrane associated rhomboid family serine protease